MSRPYCGQDGRAPKAKANLDSIVVVLSFIPFSPAMREFAEAEGSALH